LCSREIVVKGFRVKEGLLYTKEHEWILVREGEGVVGITDYAQKSLHEIVYVELPPRGAHVKKGESIGTVESIKAVSDVYSPVSGEIIDVNEELANSPELLNEDPYSNWIAKLKIENPEELKQLMDARAYAEYISALE
jgi:glycine cleavage system H protein